MHSDDMRQLVERLSQRASWYDKPADFRAGVEEMARCCEDFLNHDSLPSAVEETAATTVPSHHGHDSRVG